MGPFPVLLPPSQVYQVTFPLPDPPSTSGGNRPAASSYAPSPDLFSSLFPFHFIIDRDCRLQQVSVLTMTTLARVKGLVSR